MKVFGAEISSAKVLVILVFGLSVSSCQETINANINREGYDPRNPPLPYAYTYSVASPAEGDFKSHAETRMRGSEVVGEYRLAQPDGCVRHVTYRASWENGFVPEVRYSGNCNPAFYTAPEPVKAETAPADISPMTRSSSMPFPVEDSSLPVPPTTFAALAESLSVDQAPVQVLASPMPIQVAANPAPVQSMAPIQQVDSTMILNQQAPAKAY